MKKILGLLVAAALVTLTSCETTREISINENGGGTLVTTTDMSSLIGIMKMSGQDIDKDEKAIDTSIALDKMVDSIPDLSADEKELVRKGMLGLVVNMDQEKLVTRLQFPFENASQIQKLDAISNKVMKQAMQKHAGGGGEGAPIPENQMPESSIDEYFTLTYENGVIERRHIPEKYAKIGADEGLQGLKEASANGMPMNTTFIFNLPKPAKKAEGKNVQLSEDKKKVTIANTLDDFFDDVTKMEFRIEY